MILSGGFSRRLPEGLQGAVGRAVIDNDNATKFNLIASNSRERFYTFQKMMPGVPIYNDRIKPSLARFGVIDGHIGLGIYLKSFASATSAVHRQGQATLLTRVLQSLLLQW